MCSNRNVHLTKAQQRWKHRGKLCWQHSASASVNWSSSWTAPNPFTAEAGAGSNAAPSRRIGDTANTHACRSSWQQARPLQLFTCLRRCLRSLVAQTWLVWGVGSTLCCCWRPGASLLARTILPPVRPEHWSCQATPDSLCKLTHIRT